jgi:hypothetical protein
MTQNWVRRVRICKRAVSRGSAADGMINWKGCGQTWRNRCHKRVFY